MQKPTRRGQISRIHIADTAAPSRNGRGITILELIVAGILLSAVLSTAIPTMSLIVRDHRSTEQRREAIAEVSNIMEHLTSLPWERLADEAAAPIRLDDTVAAQLPGAKLFVKIAETTDVPKQKQITVELTWKSGPNRPTAPVRLTAWVVNRGERR